MNSILYTAGPITGLSYAEATLWRTEVSSRLTPHGITVLSPVRHKPILIGQEEIADEYSESHLATARSYVTRDRFDVRRSDFMISNFQNCKRVASYGTLMEISLAYELNIPVCMVADEDDHHRHPFVLEHCTWDVTKLSDAISIAKAVLLP